VFEDMADGDPGAYGHGIRALQDSLSTGRI
jgi:hypothetical protein